MTGGAGIMRLLANSSPPSITCAEIGRKICVSTPAPASLPWGAAGLTGKGCSGENGACPHSHSVFPEKNSQHPPVLCKWDTKIFKSIKKINQVLEKIQARLCDTGKDWTSDSSQRKISMKSLLSAIKISCCCHQTLIKPQEKCFSTSIQLSTCFDPPPWKTTILQAVFLLWVTHNVFLSNWKCYWVLLPCI